MTLTLTDGAAEIFGAELPKGTKTELPGGKYAIFSWSGATVELVGETEHAYSARETPMRTYLNVDGVLEERRKEAASGTAGTSRDGPRTALVGPTDVGRALADSLATSSNPC